MTKLSLLLLAVSNTAAAEIRPSFELTPTIGLAATSYRATIFDGGEQHQYNDGTWTTGLVLGVGAGDPSRLDVMARLRASRGTALVQVHAALAARWPAGRDWGYQAGLGAGAGDVRLGGGHSRPALGPAAFFRVERVRSRLATGVEFEVLVAEGLQTFQASLTFSLPRI